MRDVKELFVSDEGAVTVCAICCCDKGRVPFEKELHFDLGRDYAVVAEKLHKAGDVQSLEAPSDSVKGECLPRCLRVTL